MTQMTPESFAVADLQALGITPTAGDVAVIEAQENAEGGHWHNHAWFNPLNTTLVYDGSTPIDGNPHQNNGHPVQAYTSWADGLAATVKTQQQPVYEPILAALRANDPAAAAQAIVNSPWGTSKISLDGTTYTKNGAPAAAPSGTSSTGVGAQDVGLFGAHGWNPLNWPGQILDAGVSGVWDQVQPFLVTGLFAAGALAVVVLGAKQLVQPVADKVEQTLKANPELAMGAAA